MKFEKKDILAKIPPAIQLALTLHFLRHVIKQRKSPSSTLAWLFIVRLQPFVALPLYALLGNRKIHLTKPLLPFPTQHPVFSDPMQRVAMASGSPDPCGNAKLRLITDGEEAFTSMMELIANAKESLFLETYIFSNDEVGVKVLEALTLKAQAGLDVRILLDSFGALISRAPSFKNYIAAGGKFLKFMPMLKNPFHGSTNLRNHRKVLVADYSRSMTGGMNIAKEYMGPSFDSKRWIDQAMVIEGPLVLDMARVFKQDWAFADGKLDEENPPLVKESFPGHVAQLVASGPDVYSDPIHEWLLNAIYTAKECIWITTPYFIPDESLAKALELAAKRGVDVKIVTPRRSNHMIADLARSTYLEQLESAGGKIMLHERMIHAKVTLIDQKYGFAGSANMDARSLLLNYELGIALYSPEDIEQLRTWFESLFPSCSLGVVKRTAVQGWVGGMARIMSPLL